MFNTVPGAQSAAINTTTAINPKLMAAAEMNCTRPLLGLVQILLTYHNYVFLLSALQIAGYTLIAPTRHPATFA